MIVEGVLFGLVSLLGFGLSNAFAVVPIRKVGTLSVIFWRGVFLTVLLVFATFLFNGPVTFSARSFLFAAALSLLGYVPLYFFYKGLSVGKIGIVSPVANSWTVFVVLFGLLFLGEALTWLQLLFIGLIAVGVFFISARLDDFRRHGVRFSAGLGYALLACLFWGVVMVIYKVNVGLVGAFFAALLVEVAAVVMSFAHLRLSGGRLVLPARGLWLQLLLVAFFGVAATLGFTLGVSVAPVAIIAPIAAASPLVSALYASVVFKERLSVQQWLSAVVVVLGLVGLSAL